MGGKGLPLVWEAKGFTVRVGGKGLIAIHPTKHVLEYVFVKENVLHHKRGLL